MEKKRELELYIHIPFCAKKCAYCDFLSWKADAQERQVYVETLIEEIRQAKKQYESYQVSSIFFGGGTPSVLEAEQTEAIFSALRDNFQIENGAEITNRSKSRNCYKRKSDILEERWN